MGYAVHPPFFLQELVRCTWGQCPDGSKIHDMEGSIHVSMFPDGNFDRDQNWLEMADPEGTCSWWLSGKTGQDSFPTRQGIELPFEHLLERVCFQIHQSSSSI